MGQAVQVRLLWPVLQGLLEHAALLPLTLMLPLWQCRVFINHLQASKPVIVTGDLNVSHQGR